MNAPPSSASAGAGYRSLGVVLTGRGHDLDRFLDDLETYSTEHGCRVRFVTIRPGRLTVVPEFDLTTTPPTQRRSP